ncbi:AraC family transcriptional regulator [Sphingobium amiense]|uniref:AraC family transcriptional regulator n=1 Tax=Sphingobium amiense TaxID=135719 RepID=A0A494W836_9SPHN|nr:AraC family transcriptional regulator [Sphingobium amiense]BBD96800.1 AraC family transcriptional regulator [Sphingobium amiense]
MNAQSGLDPSAIGGVPSGATALASFASAGVLSPTGRGRGLRQAVSVRQGLTVASADVTFEQETDLRIECPGAFLRFHFRLEGDSVVSGERGETSQVSAGTILVVAHPVDSYKRETVGIDTTERSVTLICSKDYATELLGPTDGMPPFVGEYLRNEISGLSLLSRPMPPKVQPIVEDILKPKLPGRLGDMMVEAKALELLCYTVHRLLHVSDAGPTVRERDRKRVRDLCAILDRDPSASLSIEMLCRELAWNDTQMTECFKAVTGTTISNYRLQVRMRHARRQLEETDSSITQIAYEAGYEYPGNFTTAFRRTFGIPPRALRS